MQGEAWSDLTPDCLSRADKFREKTGKRELDMFQSAKMFVAAAALALAGSVAGAATVGYDAIARGNADGFSNFVIRVSQAVFPAGTISAWNTFIGAIDGGQPGTMGLLVLHDTGSGTYNVVASDSRTVNLGLNAFTSNISVGAGDVLAIWMGHAKVAFDYSGSGAGDGHYSGNGAFPSTPGGAISVNAGTSDRFYSINATVNTSVVPLPATGVLLFGAVGGIAALRRRKSV